MNRTISYEDIESEVRYIQEDRENAEDLESYDEETDWQPTHDSIEEEDDTE